VVGRRARAGGQGDGEVAQAPVVLCLVPDYLKLNVRGTLKKEIVEWFEREKHSLQESGHKWRALKIPECPGGYVYLTCEWQKGYWIRFHNHIFYGGFTSHGNSATFRMKIKAQVLNTGDWDYIEETIDAITGCFMSRVGRVQVSRIDLAVDFQAEGFVFPDVRDAVTRASRRTFDTDSKTGLEGLIFGKRTPKETKRDKDPKLQAVLYNKSTEIKESGKLWMHDVYRRAKGYDEALTVYRVEFRFFREMLREMKRKDQDGRTTGIETVKDLRESLGDLARVAVVRDGERVGPWLRFCDPETRHKNVRPPAEWWKAVAEGFTKDLTVSGRFREHRKGIPNPSQIETMLLAGNAKWESYRRLTDPHCKKIDLEDYPSPLREDLEAVLRSRSSTWEEEVKKHMGRLKDAQARAELSEDADKAA